MSSCHIQSNVWKQLFEKRKYFSSLTFMSRAIQKISDLSNALHICFWWSKYSVSFRHVFIKCGRYQNKYWYTEITLVKYQWAISITNRYYLNLYTYTDLYSNKQVYTLINYWTTYRFSVTYTCISTFINRIKMYNWWTEECISNSIFLSNFGEMFEQIFTHEQYSKRKTTKTN